MKKQSSQINEDGTEYALLNNLKVSERKVSVFYGSCQHLGMQKRRRR